MRTLDTNRWYEITDLAPNHVWWSEWHSRYDVRGAIVRPTTKDDCWLYEVIRSSPHNFPSARMEVCMNPNGLRLRPLTEREANQLRKKDTANENVSR